MALDTFEFTAELDSTGRWILLTALSEGMTEITVFRITRDGTSAVRGAFNKEVTNAFVGADYEAPQNTPLAYFARYSDGVQTRESPVVSVVGTVDRGGDVLFGLTNPLAWLRVNVNIGPDLTSRGRQDSVQVVGRRDPVVVSDVRLFPNGTLTVITLTDSERNDLNSLLAPGQIIAFSPHQPTYGFSDVWYLSIGDVTERRTAPLGLETSRFFDLQFQRVAPPPADFIGPAFQTWGDVKDDGLTWGDWLTSGTTWLRAQVR